jgi:hypothetical protein
MTAAAPVLRVSPVYARVHYLACDKTGACAAFEHVGGKQVVTPGARALTNHSYAESRAWAGEAGPAADGRRLAAALRAAPRVHAATPPTGDPVTAAFGVLDGVRWSQSQWNIVYDPVHLRVSFRTRVSRGIKTLDSREARTPRAPSRSSCWTSTPTRAATSPAACVPTTRRPTAPSSNAASAASATSFPRALST